jgi:hypothetical protein
MTTYNTDLSTIAAAWASSPLGRPGESVDPTGAYGAITEAPEPRPTARRAAVVAAMLGAILVSPMVGLAVYLYTDAAESTAELPGSGAAPAVPQAPSAIPQESAAPMAPSAPEGSAPANAAGPNPVVHVPERTVVPQAGGDLADVGSPHVGAPGDTTVTVDIPVPDPAPASDPLPPEPAPEPPPPDSDPEPEPPALVDPLPAPEVELEVTPRIVDPPISTEPSIIDLPGYEPSPPEADWDAFPGP